MTNLFHVSAPGIAMTVAAVMLLGLDRQQSVPLAAPLATLEFDLPGFRSEPKAIAEEERRVAGMDDYLYREFSGASGPVFSVYVGYYQNQMEGRTIHSPRNCLPGAGWEQLSVTPQTWSLSNRRVVVRRFLLAKNTTRAVVYYWYQGRGRISSNEYRVKWELLRDAARRGRTEEALVRIVVPVRANEAEADSVAVRVAAGLIPAVNRVLPVFP